MAPRKRWSWLRVDRLLEQMAGAMGEHHDGEERWAIQGVRASVLAGRNPTVQFLAGGDPVLLGQGYEAGGGWRPRIAVGSMILGSGTGMAGPDVP